MSEAFDHLYRCTNNMEEWRNGNFPRQWWERYFCVFTCSETQSAVELRWSVVGTGGIFLRLQDTLWDDCLLETRSDTKLWLMPKFSSGLRSAGLGSLFSTSIEWSPSSASTGALQSGEKTAAPTSVTDPHQIYLLGLCVSNCRARATGSSELAVTTITTSNRVDTSGATQLWTLLSWLDGCLAALATWFKDIPMPSVNNACTGICTQVEVSLLPAESALRREEGRVVKPLTNCISHALLGFCWCCSVQDDLGQAVAAAQREVLPLTSCCQG